MPGLRRPDFFGAARADTLTEAERIHMELRRLAEAGCADVLLLPCSGDLEQVSLLAEALRASTYAGVDMGAT